MAAKQTTGLTAHWSQASEDAKRWSRTWLPVAAVGGTPNSSNSNTVCTIKSAPPRTATVLNLLATKSGWLYKRNEQHVWQARWCCVVPHMFLYYFDAAAVVAGSHAVGGLDEYQLQQLHQSSMLQQPPTAQQQDEWNQAVKDGYGKSKPRHEKRAFGFGFSSSSGAAAAAAESNSGMPPAASPHYNANAANMSAASASALHHHTTTNDAAFDGTLHDDLINANSNTTTSSNWQQQQPAGIIDLECYTTANRSSLDSRIWELAGDSTTNPDLRPFYFLAANDTDDSGGADEWTAALLHNRHAALQDEVEAYKQVCDGFSQQLQQLHQQLDAAAIQQEQAAAELYRVRSHQEDVRRKCWTCLDERLLGAVKNNSSSAQQQAILELRQHLERLRTQDFGGPNHIQSLVQVVVEYATQLEQACQDLEQAKESAESQLKLHGQSDAAKVQQLQSDLDVMQKQHAADKASWQTQLQQHVATNQQTAKQLQDLQKELAATKLEMTMHGSQQRNKLATVAAHKKILKKEVLDLRCSLEQATQQLTTLQHEAANSKLLAAQHEQKCVLLERYVEKMESQVKVQQNMMELMSQTGSVVFGNNNSGGGSAFGGGGSVYGGGSVGYGERRGGASYKRGSKGSNDDDDHDRNRDGVDDDDDEHHHEMKLLRSPHVVKPRASPPFQHPPRQQQQRQQQQQQQEQIPVRRGFIDDADNKSHVSELTEDRTQRHFEAISREYGYHQQQQHRSSVSDQRRLGESTNQRSPTKGPPAIIIGVNQEDEGLGEEDVDSPRQQQRRHSNNNMDQHHQQQQLQDDYNNNRRSPFSKAHISSNLDTIHSTAMSLPPAGGGGSPYGSVGDSRRKTVLPRRGDASSAVSTASEFRRKLSVAQRARLEADQRLSTPVKASLDEKSKLAVEQHQRLTQQQRTPPPSSNASTATANNNTNHANDQSSSNSRSLWRKMEEAVLGPRSDSDDDDGGSSIRSSRLTDYTDRTPRHEEEKKVGDSAPSTPVSLQERSRLQRAKQLQFLREQGLIQNEEDVRGGAGADSASVASPSLPSFSGLRTSISETSPGGGSTVTAHNRSSPLVPRKVYK